MSQEKKLKLIFIGPEGSGKTSLISRSLYNTFNKDYRATIGVDFLSKSYDITSLTSQEIRIHTQLWDTAGQKRFASLIPSYMRDAAAVGIVLTPPPGIYDVTEIRKYIKEQALEYRKLVEEHAPNVPICFIISKIDLFSELDKQQLQLIAKDTVKDQLPADDQSSVVFCSAKTGDGVNEVFQTMGTSAYAYCSEPKPTNESELLTSPQSSYPHSPPSPTWWEIIENFITNHEIEAYGNAFLAVAAIVTLVTLASLPIGGAPILFGLSVLAVAGIATGAAFLLWNLGCLIANLCKGGGGGPPSASASADKDDDDKDWEITTTPRTSTQQPNPTQYQKLHFDPSSPTPTPTGTTSTHTTTGTTSTHTNGNENKLEL